MGTILLSNNPVHFDRSKHISLRHHFLRDQVNEHVIKLEHVPFKINQADLFTKSLSADLFQKLRNELGLTQRMKPSQHNPCYSVEEKCWKSTTLNDTSLLKATYIPCASNALLANGDPRYHLTMLDHLAATYKNSFHLDLHFVRTPKRSDISTLIRLGPMKLCASIAPLANGLSTH